MIPSAFVNFYGDQLRWFFGEVVNVKDDPLKLGRAQVRVFGIYDDVDAENKPVIAEKDLPWAQIVVPITQGIHEGKGQNLGLLVGTQVFGIFLDGQNSQLPMIIGSVPKEGDTNEKAKENYPLNKVYETERGHFKEYDDTEGNSRIKEQHKSGTHYEIFEEGDRTTVVVGNDKLDVTGNVTIQVEKNATIDVTGDAKVISKKSIDLTAPEVIVRGNTIKLNS